MHTTIGVVVHCTEQVGQKLGLQKRLAARNRNSAAAIELVVTLDLIHEVLDGHHRAAVDRPGIGIVAVEAPHGTALEKHHIADSGAIHRAKALKGMDASSQFRHGDHILSWKVREMTSSCWARVSLIKLTA